jgi:hypothetical protein
MSVAPKALRILCRRLSLSTGAAARHYRMFFYRSYYYIKIVLPFHRSCSYRFIVLSPYRFIVDNFWLDKVFP